jgi:hypothetical protein
MNYSQPSFALLAVFLWLLVAVGCGERSAPAPAGPASVAMSPGAMVRQERLQANAPAPAESAADAQAATGEGPAVPGRYIAYTHRYAIEAERARLRAVLDAHLARCKAIDCVVLSQSFVEENDNNPPSAALSVRVARKDTANFTDALKSGEGRVINQSSVAEDKTLQVVDIEARIANLTQLRDRLRKLMADPKAGIKEAVEIERQLAQTQGELDSMQSQRRVLAQQTERELFEINYQSRRSAVERSVLEPVKDALLSFGGVFMRSVAGLISFIAAGLIWIVAAAVLWWLIRRWRRRRSMNKII